MTVAEAVREAKSLLELVVKYVEDAKTINDEDEPGADISNSYFILCHQISEEASWYLEKALEKMRARKEASND